ncbi:MAG: hypothetical protein M1546_13600, partial [Chloroflexi bacterium]|nr:hypothetical protein [Chloroflexota bacterium]
IGIPYAGIAAMMRVGEKRVGAVITWCKSRKQTVPFVDWHDHAARFPRIAQSARKLLAGQALSFAEMSLLRSIMLAWGGYYNIDIPQTTMPRITPQILHDIHGRLKAAGVDPFELGEGIE